MFFVSCVSHAFASVHCCLVVTCWERADLLALGLDIFIHIFIYIVIYKYTVYNTIMMGFRKKSNDLYKSVSL